MSDFSGFYPPKENYSKLPHQLIDELHTFSSLAELKVVLYVMRHTWGYQDDYKRITLEEFEHGRKERDGSRIDKGVGMTKPSIIDGIKRAIEHGFLHAHTDETDNARVKKFYSLTESGLKSFTSEVKESDSSSKESSHRTEKETKERNSEKETKKDSSSLPEEAAPSDIAGEALLEEALPEPVVEELETPVIQAEELPIVIENVQAVVEESASQLEAPESSENAPVEQISPDPAPEGTPDADVAAVIDEAEELVKTNARYLNDCYQEVVRRALGKPNEPLNPGKLVGRYIKIFKGAYVKGEHGAGKDTLEYQLSDDPMLPAEIAGFALCCRKEWDLDAVPQTLDTFRRRVDQFRALPSRTVWIAEGQKRLDQIMSGASENKPKSRVANAQKPPSEADMTEVDWEAEERKYQESIRGQQKSNVPA
jgi:DNA-binding PadR family transcriptional regulator